jgi:hypothetical protein
MLCPKTKFEMNMVINFLVIVIVTLIREPYRDSEMKMKFWPTAPAAQKQSISARALGCLCKKLCKADSSLMP